MKKSVFIVASLLIVAADPAIAQETDQAEVPKGDIVVTANRFESKMSDTPIAMSAFTGDDLSRAGVTNPTQLADSIPNVSIVRGDGLQITIRGVTSTDGTE